MRVLMLSAGAGRCGTLLILATAPILFSLPAMASGAGPGGVNIGFDFNWNIGPNGYTASFIQTVTATGATLNNCGPVSPTSGSCDFAFSYSIGGVAQTPVVSGGAYETWNGECEEVLDTAPLTLFNCFNVNSFGQIFIAPVSGALSNFTMQMTCLNPAGGTLTGLVALIYQVNGGTTIGATPLAQVPVNLSSCPTLTNWTGHTFTSADFAAIPLNFSGVTVTAGNAYGVYFSGLVPGTPPPAPPPTPTTPAPPAFWLALVGLGTASLLALGRRRTGETSAPQANGTRGL